MSNLENSYDLKNINNTIYKDYINIKELEIKDLPSTVSISTMCATGNIGTKINKDNIEQYLMLDTDNVLSVKIDQNNQRTLIPKKKRKNRSTNNDSNDILNTKKTIKFQNQITIVMRLNEGNYIQLDKEPQINIKLFKNGSIQMSGCKTVQGINIAINKLIIKLSEVKARIENKEIFSPQYENMNETLNIINTETLYDLVDNIFIKNNKKCNLKEISTKYITNHTIDDGKTILETKDGFEILNYSNNTYFKTKRGWLKNLTQCFVEKKFVDNPDDLNLVRFKIDMINSNYKLDMWINRESLYKLLLENNIKSNFEPCIRACVIVKFVPPEENPEEKETSIFVFEKGNIIITGAKKQSHIIDSYNYINGFIKNNIKQVEKKDLDDCIKASGFYHLIDNNFED